MPSNHASAHHGNGRSDPIDADGRERTGRSPSVRRARRVASFLDRFAAGSNDGTDRVADRLAQRAAPLVRAGTARDLLAGTPNGHPAHPAVVVWPLGTWLSASLLDLGGRRWAGAARTMVAAGVAGAVPAAATGLSDWLDTSGAERRLGLLHASCTAAATALQATSLVVRGRRRGLGVALSGLAMAGAGVGGWLGGHLAYRWGVGVNTTAFQSGPGEWTDVAGVDELHPRGRLAVRIGATALLLTTRGEEVSAIESRCTHRGGPLHDGELRDGCAVCPWHGSRFDAVTGAVRRGPATSPQPAYETRVQDGRVLVRRHEIGSLRSNPQAGEEALPLRSS
ncbi:MAG: Rieske (2Fe-2S) protein [Acidimicrobiia bacterium]